MKIFLFYSLVYNLINNQISIFRFIVFYAELFYLMGIYISNFTLRLINLNLYLINL